MVNDNRDYRAMLQMDNGLDLVSCREMYMYAEGKDDLWKSQLNLNIITASMCVCMVKCSFTSSPYTCTQAGMYVCVCVYTSIWIFYDWAELLHLGLSFLHLADRMTRRVREKVPCVRVRARSAWRFQSHARVRLITYTVVLPVSSVCENVLTTNRRRPVRTIRSMAGRSIDPCRSACWLLLLFS